MSSWHIIFLHICGYSLSCLDSNCMQASNVPGHFAAALSLSALHLFTVNDKSGLLCSTKVIRHTFTRLGTKRFKARQHENLDL